MCAEKNSLLLEYVDSYGFIKRKSKIKIKCPHCGRNFITSLETLLNTKKDYLCNDCSFENAPNSLGEQKIKKNIRIFTNCF